VEKADFGKAPVAVSFENDIGIFSSIKEVNFLGT
jgi:hypothetical protein